MAEHDKPTAATPNSVATFSEAEYSANPSRVFAQAAATGKAIVLGADGKPRMLIDIPTVDLPTLDY